MGFFSQIVKSLFAAPVAPAKPVFQGWTWDSGLLSAESVVYTMTSPGEGLNESTLTASKRARVGVEGGALMGKGKAEDGKGKAEDGKKALSPTLAGFVSAVDGSTGKAVYGLPIHGHRDARGFRVKFAIDSFLTEALFTDLAKALTSAKRDHGRFQILVRCVHLTFGPGTKYHAESADYGHEWRKERKVYGGIQSFVAPVKVIGIEVIVPGDERWVDVPVEGLDVSRMFSDVAEPSLADKKAKAKAEDARYKKLKTAFSSFDQLHNVEETVTTVAPTTRKPKLNGDVLDLMSPELAEGGDGKVEL